MKVVKRIILHLDESEYTPLKILLGNIDDNLFADYGVKGRDREIMSEIYDQIPHPEDS